MSVYFPVDYFDTAVALDCIDKTVWSVRTSYGHWQRIFILYKGGTKIYGA